MEWLLPVYHIVKKELDSTKTGGSPYGPTHLSSGNDKLSEEEY